MVIDTHHFSMNCLTKTYVQGDKMKITNKLSSIMGSLIIALTITLFLPSAVHAKRDTSKSHTSYCKKSKNSHTSWKSHRSNRSKGYSTSWNKKSSHSNKGSRGSCGSWSGKGSRGSHGSWSGKDSRGSRGSWSGKDSRGSWSGKNSRGSRGSWSGKDSRGSCGSWSGKDSRGSRGSWSGKNSHGSCGSWSKGSCNSSGNTTSNCNKYKEMADKYLRAYYKCYNYRYYQYYLYYIKKFNQCKASTPVVPDCSKYKDLADRYLAAYQKCHNYTYYRYYDYYKKLYEKCQAEITPTPEKKGNICSTIFEDENENGKQDSNEKGTSGIKFTLVDKNGDSYTIETDSRGKYCFKNIPEGNATITLDLTSLPDKASHTIGEVSDKVIVVGNKTRCAPKDAYIMAAPVKKGAVYGTVYYDKDKNKIQDDDEPGKAGIKVTILDSDNKPHDVITNDQGYYHLEDIVVGPITITVDTDSLPKDAELSDPDANPTTITVEENKENNAGKDGYFIVAVAP